MNATTTTVASTPVTSAPVNSSEYWDRILRAVVAYFIHGRRPGLGASAGALAAFHDGERDRFLIATAIAGMAIL